ncbi:hypothetical protein FOZ61_000940 [Perkinsus olseni]|uniref:Calcium permeable stress-gated cation channel 1 n=1 Tax=Perkinsus olseni TaxID=32597 RepID=A0A7J6MFB6_PEROL|nr:hypothetical protein FOL46_006550 [Perkinsus olseni]KAF4670279.1 hypothetical protein FOZ61_000940 [Perkinsus olseni]
MSAAPIGTGQLDQNAVLLSFGIFGGIFAATVVAYSGLRLRFPRLYQPRQCIEALRCSLSSRVYAMFGSWIPGAMRITDDELFADAGLDAVAFIRLLRLGARVALVGCLNAIYLIPVYKYQGSDLATADELARWSLGHLPSRSPSLLATLFASYIIFCFTLLMVYREFAWYTAKRHAFMCRENVANYSVFVRHIPVALRSNRGLHEFFEEFIPGGVADVQVALDMGKLSKKVKEREDVVLDLEHAYNVWQQKGYRPRMRPSLFSREKVDTITALENRLAELNQSIETDIDDAESFQDTTGEQLSQRKLPELSEVAKMVPLVPLKKIVPSKSFRVLSDGFVTFRSLQATVIAQRVHLHDEPYALCIKSAPLPDEVYWSNVGMPHFHQFLGIVMSLAATVALCIFWTIPVTFVVSISKVSYLKHELPFLQSASETWPPLDTLLQLLSPIALALLNELLPFILTFFSKWEGHISLATLDASLFGKLALLYIVQTFFVSAIAGSVLSGIRDLVSTPLKTLQKILSTNLPQQANYFISFVFVRVGLGLGIELIRLVPAALALLRRCLGPGLSEKERSRIWLGLEPLEAPIQLELPRVLSTVMLFFMILFVYSVMSPITCLVMAFGFSCFSVVYKNQFASVYDPSNDTGGQLWTRAVRVILGCAVAAEFTVMGVLAIKEAAVVSPLMLPLLIGTIIFWSYLEVRHFVVASSLPAKVFVDIDRQRAVSTGGTGNVSWNGCYKPIAMRQRNIQPDVAEEKRTVFVRAESNLSEGQSFSESEADLANPDPA